MQITLTMEEAQILTNLLDAAVKASGLQAAEAAIHFAKMIKNAADAEAAVKPQDPSAI
jgi:hypothetical protein